MIILDRNRQSNRQYSVEIWRSSCKSTQNTNRITKSEAFMDAKTKVKENRLRRIASRQGLRVEKSRQRDTMALDYGKYSLVSGRPDHIHVFIGQADLDQVEDWLESGHRLNRR
jgi:hypothetical protein